MTITYYSWSVAGTTAQGNTVGPYVGTPAQADTLPPNSTLWVPPPLPAGSTLVQYWDSNGWYFGQNYLLWSEDQIKAAYINIANAKLKKSLATLRASYSSYDLDTFPVQREEARIYQSTGASAFIAALAGDGDQAALAASVLSQSDVYYNTYAAQLCEFKLEQAKTNIVLSDVDLVYGIQNHIL